jgi:hypothetical protein
VQGPESIPSMQKKKQTKIVARNLVANDVAASQ